MIPKAIIFEKRVEIPHGGWHSEYYLKMLDLKPFQRYYGYIADLPDAPARYRGPIEVNCLWDKLPSVGERLQFGPYHLRVVERNPMMDSVTAVLDNWLSFIPVWRRKLYWYWMNVLWRLVATAQVWGIMERPDPMDISVAIPKRSLWKHIYIVQKLSRIVTKFRRRAA